MLVRAVKTKAGGVEISRSDCCRCGAEVVSPPDCPVHRHGECYGGELLTTYRRLYLAYAGAGGGAASARSEITSATLNISGLSAIEISAAAKMRL